MENDKNNRIEITPQEALIDGLSFITQKLNSFVDNRKMNLMPISELLLRLSIPNKKTEVNSEDIFIQNSI